MFRVHSLIKIILPRAIPRFILKEVARTAAQGQLLGRVASALAIHGIIPYLS